MAKNLWRVQGTYVCNGIKEVYDDIHEAPSASKAEQAAMKRYNSEARVLYPKRNFSKLKITKVTPFKGW